MDAGIRVDREAEVAVLGAVLLDNEMMLTTRPILRAQDISVLALVDRREPIDVGTLAAMGDRSHCAASTERNDGPASVHSPAPGVRP